VPEAGTAADAGDRFEQLGGKGANQAVALAQLGVRPRLVAVAGALIVSPTPYGTCADIAALAEVCHQRGNR
jgi:hypothetical protein